MAFVYDTKAQAALGTENPITLAYDAAATAKLLVAAIFGATTTSRTGGTPTFGDASYASKSKSLTGEGLSPVGVAFSSDGTKMYVYDETSDDIFQYTLSTAWDVSTASYDSVSYAPGEGEVNPDAITFSSDGTKMYLVGAGTNTVYQYTLSTAWNLSTASYASKNKYVGSQDAIIRGIAFSSDGTKMYIAGDSNNTVYQYTLSTAWDVSTASYASKSKSVGSEDVSPMGVAFSSDGTKMYISGASNDTVFQYILSTAWDVSTASYASKKISVASEDTGPMDLAFSSDGTKMYIAGALNSTIYQYTLGTAWDLNSVFTQVGATVVGSGECTTELWYITDPITTASTIRVPNAGALSLRVEAFSFTSTGGTPTLFGNTSTNTTAENPSLTINSVPDGSACVEVLGSGYKDVATGRSHTQLYSNDEGSWVDESQYTIKSGTGNLSMSFTQSSDDVAMIMAAWQEGATGVTVTPAAAACVASKNGPTVVKGSISISPAASSAVAASVNPTVLNNVTLAPAAASSVAANVDPTVVQGNIVLSPTAGSAVAASVAPAVILGSIIIAPTAASCVASKAEPIILNPVTLSPVAASAIADSVNPTVVNDVTLTPAASSAVALSIAPTVIQSSLVLTPVAASAIGGKADLSVLIAPLYSRGAPTSLPADDADLANLFTGAEYASVETDDGDRVAQLANTGQYSAFLFKDKHTQQEAFTAHWNGQSSLAPSSSAILLQVFNRNTPAWETIDSDNISGADTDLTLEGSKSTNLSNYFDGSFEIACRVYQQVS